MKVANRRIRRRKVNLQEVPPIDRIPVRPPGYLANCYSKVESREENRLAKVSVIDSGKFSRMHD